MSAVVVDGKATRRRRSSPYSARSGGKLFREAGCLSCYVLQVGVKDCQGQYECLVDNNMCLLSSKALTRSVHLDTYVAAGVLGAGVSSATSANAWYRYPGRAIRRTACWTLERQPPRAFTSLTCTRHGRAAAADMHGIRRMG